MTGPNADPGCVGQIRPIRSMEPPIRSRVWMSTPHPRLPIVATASTDKTVRIYSLDSFHQVGTISGGHKRSVRSCAWKPSSGIGGQPSVLATGSFDSSAGIWKRAELAGEDGAPSSSRPNNQSQATRGGRYDVDVDGEIDDEDDDDDDEWQYAVMLDGHESEIKGVAWSASGQYLATCSRDKTVWVWEDMSYTTEGRDTGYDGAGGDGDDDNFETVAVLQEHDGDIKTVCWHPTEELVASGSYDNTIRLYREDFDDWTSVATMTAHTGTIWGLDWEADGAGDTSAHVRLSRYVSGQRDERVTDEDRHAFVRELARSGPRLASCSDDKTVRIWQRQPQATKPNHTGLGSTIPNIIRPQSPDETWTESAILPSVHTRSVYSVSWSKRTGLIASAGSDGIIAVYAERWTQSPDRKDDGNDETQETYPIVTPTEWVVVAKMYDAHDVYEINHVVWAQRTNTETGILDEVLVTSGDDGNVRVWQFEGTK